MVIFGEELDRISEFQYRCEFMRMGWLYPSDLNTHSCLRVGDTIALFASIHSQSTSHVGCVLDGCWGGKR